MRFTKYLKVAFANRWNLLALFGGLGLAVVSGAAGVVIPLVAAGELLYLGLLGTHPKFQSYVDAQAAKSAEAQSSVAQEQMLRQIVRSLPKQALQRFDALRNRCLELRQIALALKHSSAEGVRPLDDLQLAGLDRLLWIYLRLLFTQYSLERFFEKTAPEPITADIQRLEKRLKAAPPAGDDPNAQKIRKALEDNLQTCNDRLANLRKAKQTYEILQLELERLENKIRSLSELAVNRQEPDFITGQVDQVASSMVETERTMNELQFATGLQSLHEEAPQLLQRPTVQAKGG
ncbi:MAG: hypothetical protein HYX69_08715 [Planctomycetia bacterium]|nr:hypothetical protein [Planctomycetia bacterium]